VRHAAGVAGLPVKITGVARWRATSDVARYFRSGRVFLAGDSAHLMPPNGGYGGNTGIHDGHNLAWKLALVLAHVAGPGLLDTYEAERRPAAAFTVEQAYTRYVTRTAPFLGKQDFQPLADDFDIELGYLYHSSAIVPATKDDDAGDRVHEHPSASRGRPGSRAPHVWIQQRGQRISALDLFRGSFVLLAGPDGNAWFDAASRAAARIAGLKLDAHRIVDDGFTAAYGISASGATLVRPDGFVAWRAPAASDDPEAELTRTLSAILRR
jgi:putative polyketide hydroxylase